MVIDKNKLLMDLQTHLNRYMHNCGCAPCRYDDGYVNGISFAIRLVRLQEEAQVGQVAFEWETEAEEAFLNERNTNG